MDPMRHGPEHNQNTLILLGITYADSPNRAMVMTR